MGRPTTPLQHMGTVSGTLWILLGQVVFTYCRGSASELYRFWLADGGSLDTACDILWQAAFLHRRTGHRQSVTTTSAVEAGAHASRALHSGLILRPRPVSPDATSSWHSLSVLYNSARMKRTTCTPERGNKHEEQRLLCARLRLGDVAVERECRYAGEGAED